MTTEIAIHISHCMINHWIYAEGMYWSMSSFSDPADDYPKATVCMSPVVGICPSSGTCRRVAFIEAPTMFDGYKVTFVRTGGPGWGIFRIESITIECPMPVCDFIIS